MSRKAAPAGAYLVGRLAGLYKGNEMTEHERFENWARRSDANPLLNRAEHDGKKLHEYHFPLARAMWEAWQAASAASPKVPQSCACSREITTGWTTDNGIPLCNVCGRVDVNAAFEMAKEPPKVPQGVEDAYQALQNELIQIQATIESFANPAAALSALIDWHVSVATDPRVNGGMALVPVSAMPAERADKHASERAALYNRGWDDCRSTVLAAAKGQGND